MGILLALALPSYRIWVQNTQIRNAAESILNGLQKAKAEAVARNTNIAFAFTNIASGVVADSSWNISVEAAASGIESRSAMEGSRNVRITVTPAAATTITFNSFGAVVANSGASATFTQIDLDSSVLAPVDSADLRVTVGAGGNARMCDPNVSAPNTRAC